MGNELSYCSMCGSFLRARVENKALESGEMEIRMIYRCPRCKCDRYLEKYPEKERR